MFTHVSEDFGASMFKVGSVLKMEAGSELFINVGNFTSRHGVISQQTCTLVVRNFVSASVLAICTL